VSDPVGEHQRSRQAQDDHAGTWRGTGPELVVAGVALVSFSAAAYVLAGLPGVVIVATVFSGVALVVFQYLLPRDSGPPPRPVLPSGGRRNTTWAYPYWRLQTRVRDGRASVFAYQSGLGPYLEHLLAARLSERHGINIYADPEAARRVLCAKRRDRDLWAWVDPARPVLERSRAAGIPSHVLARLVRRLEQL
jgi:hypothetical protein